MLNNHAANIELLAQALAVDGFSPHEARVRAAADLAGRRGAEPTCLSVVLDPAEPEVARLRAFGRIAGWITGLRTDSIHMHSPCAA